MDATHIDIQQVPYTHLIPATPNEDLHQEMVVALIEAKPATEADARVLIRRITEQARWAKRQDRRRSNALPDVLPAFDQVIADALRDDAMVERVLSRLAPDHADVLRLRYLSGLSAADCAKVLGVTQPTMRARVAAAIEAAKQIVA